MSTLAVPAQGWQGRPMAAERSPFRHAASACVLITLMGVAGCASGNSALPAAAATVPLFDPIGFFAGPTHGTGTLHILFSKPRTTDVRGSGLMTAPGKITLDQDVVQGQGAARHRSWRLRRAGPDHYTGTLTDAVGPVVADAKGNALHIAFTMKGGLRVEQRLYLQPGGEVALNRMTVRKLGVVVATLDERIERVARP
jgi:hypothetical protein